jgi:hypothetical protein
MKYNNDLPGGKQVTKGNKKQQPLYIISIMNVVLWHEPGIYGSGSPKAHQGIIGIIYLRGLASFSMVNVAVLWYESWI